MSRARDDYQDDRLDDLDRRVTALEGECSVAQDHRAILHKLALIHDEINRLAVDCVLLGEVVTAQNHALQAIVELLEPKGSLVINVGAISEIN